MKSNFDVVDYPLKIKENTKLYFNYTKTKIEFRILDTPDSKIIYASKKRNPGLLLLIEIQDNNVDIVGHTKNLYEFEGPLDFYIDNMESMLFFYNLGDNIINKSVTELLDTSQEIFDKFPPFNPPIINYHEVLPKTINVRQKSYIKRSNVKNISVHFDEPIPTENETKLQLNEIENKIVEFIINIPHPILRISHIISLFNKFKIANGIHVKNDRLKLILQKFRYYILDGPFRKSWVPFGYDPKLDKNNYKYQILDLRGEIVFCHLFENDTIVQEVEKNFEWYVKEDCDIKNGFFKKTLTQFVLYENYVKFANQKEDIEDDCFEIFDE